MFRGIDWQVSTAPATEERRMSRLGHRDLRGVLDCLQTTYATLDLEAFPRQVVAGLRRVVPAPFGSYNEIDHRAARIRYIVEPVEAQVPHLELIVRQYLHEQPVVAHYRRTGDGSPRKLSDFLTQEEFHRLDIYNENYRHRPGPRSGRLRLHRT